MKIPKNIDRYAIEDAIYRWIIGKNAERNRAIITRRIIDGIGFEKLAEEFDLSVTQTKTIVYECSNIIFGHLDSK